MNTISSKVKKVKVLTIFKSFQTKTKPEQPKVPQKTVTPPPTPSVAPVIAKQDKKPVQEKPVVATPTPAVPVASAAPIIETLKTKSSQVCIIAGDAEIHGSITSKTDIKVEGKVYGNIAGDMNVFVKGVVEGDISGKSVTIEQGSIVGNIKSLSSVLVSENSVIEGDVKCAQFDHNGSVKGNVQADTMATLKNAAVLSGDLNSQYLSIMDGAVICGVVSIDRSHEKKEAAVLAK